MSLRLRLLLAVGAIAIVALVVADFATYSALRSSLYKQVDQSLAQNPLRLTRFVNGDACPDVPSEASSVGGLPAADRRPIRATPTAWASIRSSRS